jgi:hypothetical protein
MHGWFASTSETSKCAKSFSTEIRNCEIDHTKELLERQFTSSFVLLDQLSEYRSGDI